MSRSPKYLSSLELAELFNAPASFTLGNIRSQVIARCKSAGVDIGRDGVCAFFTFTSDVDALVSTIEGQHRRNIRAGEIGSLHIVSAEIRRRMAA